METNQVKKAENFLPILSPTKLISALGVDRVAILNHLQLFKVRGAPNYPAVLKIPMESRIPALVKKHGYETVFTGIVAALYGAFGSLNLRVTVNEDQVLDIADAIIEQSAEDQLALEDLLLFLQQMTQGKAGKIYDRMDMPTFFELFETYREARHQALHTARYEESVQYKGLGDTNRTSDERDDESWKEAREILIAKYDLNERANKQNSSPDTGA